MASLTLQQLEFLVQHQIPLHRVFDASGMKRKEYQRVMRHLDLWIAYGVSPCYRRHSLKTRAGHCAQCNTARIAFSRRPSAAGGVYVAHSEMVGLVKVGMARDMHERVDQLNYYGYGGCNDWSIQHAYESERAGRVELEAHRALRAFATTRSYFRDGQFVECRELFDCEVTVAKQAVEAILLDPGTE